MGFRVWGCLFRVYVFKGNEGQRFSGLVFSVEGLGVWVVGFGFEVSGLCGFGFRVLWFSAWV